MWPFFDRIRGDFDNCTVALARRNSPANQEIGNVHPAMTDTPQHHSDPSDQWVSALIEGLPDNHPSLPNSLLDSIAYLLQGPLSERPLHATKLDKIASGLIADMSSSQST